MIRFACDCGRELQGRDEDAGRAAKCPSCGRIVTIPSRPASAEPAAPHAVQRQRGERRQRDEEPEHDRDRDRDRIAERPRADETKAAATSGKALAALLLGLAAFPCLLGNLLLASPLAIVFGALALGDIRRSGGKLSGWGLALTGMILGCVGLMCGGGISLGVVLIKPRVDEARNRQIDSNNLKQIGLAFHNMESTYGYFPAAAAYRDRDGKPLLSWRVALLPFIEQDNLFRQFRFNEPWDSEHNRPFLSRMPKTYLLPGQKNDGTTHYQVFVGPGSLFEDRTRGAPPVPGLGMPPPGAGPGFIPAPARGFRLVETLDGTSNTILIATASKSVPWTKPEDLPFDPALPLPPLGGHYRSFHGWMAIFADGSVRPIPANLAPTTLKAAITRNGGEVINLP